MNIPEYQTPEYQTKEELEDFIKSIYEKSFSESKTNSGNGCEDLFFTLLGVLDDWKKSVNDLECFAFPGLAMDEVAVFASEGIKDLIIKHSMELQAMNSIPLLIEGQIEPRVDVPAKDISSRNNPTEKAG